MQPVYFSQKTCHARAITDFLRKGFVRGHVLHMINLDRLARTRLEDAIYLLRSMMIPDKVIAELTRIQRNQRPANCPAGHTCDVMVPVRELIATVRRLLQAMTWDDLAAVNEKFERLSRLQKESPSSPSSTRSTSRSDAKRHLATPSRARSGAPRDAAASGRIGSTCTGPTPRRPWTTSGTGSQRSRCGTKKA